MPSGELVKLKIEAYKDIELKAADLVDTFTVMFNPATFSQKYEIEYVENQGQGTTGNPQKMGRIKPQDYSFEFLFDGTGASGPKIDVATEIERFLTVTGKMNDESHRPHFLKVIWGNLLSKCVLKSAQITYTLFKPDGAPLRAKVAVTVSEAIDETLRVAKEGKNSPDLTHMRQVKDSDTLPLMSYRIYGDPAYSQAVARYNGLNHFRRLEPGTKLYFPPIIELDPTLLPPKPSITGK